jgi:hypothetical protein
MFAIFFVASCQHSSPKACLSPPHANVQSRKVFVGAIHAILSIAYLEKQCKKYDVS